ncbi:MAG: hypothetical protein ACIAXF_05075 [Phycisphaerales bacterium JB063]
MKPLLLPLLLLPAVVGCHSASFGEPGNPGEAGRLPSAARDALGESASAPIDRSFFFDGGRYIEAPYIVRRRGGDIFVNDILVSPSLPWPPYDYRVGEDPGDPPLGSTPFDPVPAGADPRDNPWSLKWRYLHIHLPIEEAQSRMLALMQRSGVFDRVWQQEDDPNVFLVELNGEVLFYDLTLGPRAGRPPMSREAFIAAREMKRRHYETMLSLDIILVTLGHSELYVSGDRVTNALAALLSDRPEAEKVSRLRA